MRFDFFQIMNLIFLIFVVFVFGYFMVSIQNSDMTIGRKIAMESYIDENGVLNKGEWMWNLGEFVAIMVGWIYLIEVFSKYSSSDKENLKEVLRNKNEKPKSKK